MGIINDVFQNKLSLPKIEEILNNLLKQGNPQNKHILQDIGLLSEYNYIKLNQSTNDCKKCILFYKNAFKFFGMDTIFI